MNHRLQLGFTWPGMVYLPDHSGTSSVIRLTIEAYKHEISAGEKLNHFLIKRAAKGNLVSYQVVIQGNTYQFVDFKNLKVVDAKEGLVLLLTSL